MREFADDDLSDARFTGVALRRARLTQVDLSDAVVRGARMHRTRLIGVELLDAEITGDIEHLTINGVDVGPLVEAELNRRDPDRAAMRPTDADGFRRAWSILDHLWQATTEHARALPPDQLHVGVDGEWSYIQTLRHLGFASAAWVGRMILGDPSPWHLLDMPWDEAPGWDGIPWDRQATPTLDQVLVVRQARQAMVADVIASLTDDQLASEVSQMAPGWPRLERFALRECLLIVLNEEWHHRLFAERDLGLLATAVGDRADAPHSPE